MPILVFTDLRCANCESAFECLTGLPRPPAPGDYVVCDQCGTVQRLNDRGALYRVPIDEMHTVPMEIQVAAVRIRRARLQ